MVETYHVYQKLRSELAYAEELADTATESDMRELARVEISWLTARIRNLTYDMRVMLLPNDPRDDRPVFVEIKIDRNLEREPYELAFDLVRMYSRHFQSEHLNHTFLDEYCWGLDEDKRYIYVVNENDIYSLFKFESGIHQIIFPDNSSVTNVSLGVYPTVDEQGLDINWQDDVRIEVLPCRFPGGRVITALHAVRLTHIPTGVVAIVSGERSQFQNQFRARQLLMSKLYQFEHEGVQAIEPTEVIRIYDHRRNTVIDKRFDGMTFDLSEVIKGGLNQIIDRLVRQEQEHRLAEHNL